MSVRTRPTRAVVDTNLFISAFISKLGLPYQLRQRWYEGLFNLLVTDQLTAELEGVLQREKFTHKYGVSEEDRNAFLFLLNTRAIRVNPRRRLPVSVRDRKDEKVLAAALGGRAHYLVTGDEDLLELDGDPRIGSLRIITVRQFLDLLPH
jgi:putative PIN family toxin of toxin-antitoxin system